MVIIQWYNFQREGEYFVGGRGGDVDGEGGGYILVG